MADAPQPSVGVVLPNAQLAEAVLLGDVTLVVKSRPFALAGRDVLLIADRKAYGTVRLGKQEELSARQFHARVREHGVDTRLHKELAQEQRSWAEGPYFAWPVQEAQAFDAPQDTNVPHDAQPVVYDVTLAKSLDGGDLTRLGDVPLERIAKRIADGELSPMIWEADPPCGAFPVLVRSDAAFLTAQLRDGRPAALVQKGGAEGVVALVATTRPGLQLCAIAQVQKGTALAEGLASLDEGMRDSLSDETKTSFVFDGPCSYHELELLVQFEPPLPVSTDFAGEILDLQKDLQRADEAEVEKRIVRRGDQYCVVSHTTGRNFGCYTSREEATTRLQQLQWFKHKKDIFGLVDTPPSPERLAGYTPDQLKTIDRELHELYAELFADSDKTNAAGITREDLVNLHLFVLRELERRGYDIPEHDALADATRNMLKQDGPYAEVRPSGERAYADAPLRREEVLPHLEKPMAIRNPAVCLVGSLCTQGVSENDVDVLIRGPMDEDTMHAIKTRLGRALPPHIAQRVHFVDDALGGPIGPHVPLYDLVLVPHAGREVVQMSDETEKQEAHERLYPEKPGKLPAVLQLHARGKTVHGDLRIQLNHDTLQGFTLAFQKPDVVRDINSIEELQRLGADFSPEGSRWNKSLQLPDRVFVELKRLQPIDWLKLDAAQFEPGSIGATRFEDGVIVSIERPDVERGMLKPFALEYFFTGSARFAGRLTFRQLVGEEASGATASGDRTPAGQTFWTGGFAKVLLPSVLSRRAVETKTMPPAGQSAMPESLMDVTPAQFRFWNEKDAEKAREMRDALVAERFFTEQNVVLDDKHQFRRVERKAYTPAIADCESTEKGLRTTRFALSHQQWKGQMVVRAGASRQVWHLILRQPDGSVQDFQLQDDPLAEDRPITAVLHEGTKDSLLDLEGAVEPGAEIGGIALNPTKNTPSQVAILDSGEAEVMQAHQNFVQLIFHGKRLRGYWNLVAEEAGGRIWQLARGAEPSRAVPKDASAHFDLLTYTKDDVCKTFRTEADGTQVWSLEDRQPTDSKAGDRGRLRPPAVFQPVKPAAREANVFYDGKRAAHDAFSDGLIERGVGVEPKYNGFRAPAMRWEPGVSPEVKQSGVMIFTEDQKRDLSPHLRGFARELDELGGSFVLDGEIVGIDAAGNHIPRRDLAQFRSTAGAVDDTQLRYHAFDALYLPGYGNLTQQPYEVRVRLLNDFLKKHAAKLHHILPTPQRLVHSRAALEDAIAWATKQPGSEGAMLKQSDSTYPLGGETDGWAKVKLQRELAALVVDRHPVKGSPGTYTFTGAVGPIPERERPKWREVLEYDGKLWVKIGETGNRQLDAKPGDVIRAQFFELLLDEGPPARLRWFGPAQAVEILDGGTPATIEDVRAILAPGEVQKADAPRRDVRVFKSEEIGEERIVFGVALIPGDVDAQGDIYSADEVRKAAFSFMEVGQSQMKLQHRGAFLGKKVTVLETYVSRQPEQYGDETFPPGTWFVTTRIHDADLWEAVKRGEFTGYSIGGSARREEIS